MRKVAILQYRLLHYRLELFSKLKEILEGRGVELVLVHGQASEQERKRRDEGRLDWAVVVKNKFFNFKGRDILWQPLPREANGADLIVFMQESRILSNYPLLFKLRSSGSKVSYWGHGKNYQSTAPNGIREWWKRLLINSVDWWFAYTDMTVEHIKQCGVDGNKITNLNNAIDVSGFQREIDGVKEEDVSQWRSRLGIPEDGRVAVFCGSLYAEKKLALLVDSIDLVKKEVPSFHLVVIGDGPQAGLVNDVAKSRPWVHPVGVRTGSEKAAIFKMAVLQLNPGLVGLHVLDAFAAGLPMITTSTALHSPEIAYLENGVNGIVVQGDEPTAYGRSVANLLIDEESRLALSRQCKADASKYTVENMAQNFANGILDCLKVAR